MPTLRTYQREMVEAVRKHLGAGKTKIALISPTGSGKSLMVSAAVAACHVDGSVKLAIVATPMVHVQSTFTKYATVQCGNETLDTSTWQLMSGPGSLAAVRKAVTTPTDGLGIVVTHAALVSSKIAIDDNDLTGMLLVVDEGHHSAGGDHVNRLSSVREAWLERGGSVLVVTATPFRNDRSPVVDDSWTHVERTLGEHMADKKYAPPKLVCRTSPVEGFRPKKRAALRDGSKSGAKARREFADQLACKWEADGRPKAIFIVPAYDAKSWARQMWAAFVDAGLAPERILDATGTKRADQQRTQTRLDTEREVQCWASSSLDVIVACKRFDEASDWPLCSHVYIVGYPRSIPLTLQRWGRTFRSKVSIEGHRFSDVASVTFFVPEWTAELVEDAKGGSLRRCRDDAYLLAACLHDHTTGFAFAVEGQATRKRAFEKEGLRVPTFNPLERAEALKAIDEARAKVKDVAALVQELSDLPRARACIALAILSERVTSKYHRWLARDAWEKIAKRVKAHSKPGLEARPLVEETAVEVFRTALSSLTEADIASVDCVETVAAFTGQDVQEIIKKLGQARDNDRSFERLEAEIQAFMEEHDRVPTGADDIEWRRWGSWVYSRGYVSLADYFKRHGYWQSDDDIRTKIKVAFGDYLAKHGKPPSSSTSALWCKRDSWLRYRYSHGLSALRKEFGIAPKRRDTERSIERFKAELAAHMSAGNPFPSATHPPWKQWKQWMINHGYTYSDFNPAKRTWESIKRDILAYHAEHGKRPPLKGRKWKSTQAWLFKRGSSLKKYALKVLAEQND